MGITLKVLAASDHPASRGAAALIEAGYEDTTPLEALTPGVVAAVLQAAVLIGDRLDAASALSPQACSSTHSRKAHSSF